MQNPIGFDLGTISGPSRCAQSRGWGGRRKEEKGEKKQKASLIEFYVAVVGDLNMPEFITRRIIMPYKKWQSQTGAPHFISCSAAAGQPCHRCPHSQAPLSALFFFPICFPPLWKWNICVWHWSQKINMNLKSIHSVHLIIFWQIYLPFFPLPLGWEIRHINYDDIDFFFGGERETARRKLLKRISVNVHLF